MRSACNGLWYVAMWILYCCARVAECEADLYGLESALSQPHLDPLAHNDSFLTLPASLKKHLAQGGSFDTRAKLQSLMSLQNTVPITVKAVGFSDHQRQQLQDLFGHYIDVVTRDDRIKVIGDNVHQLPIRTKVTLDVAGASQQLAEKVEAAIQAQLQKASPYAHTNLYPVSHASIDEILQHDLKKPLSSYTIYLLNLKSQERRYAYSYNSEDSSAGFSRCLGSIWTGKDRYIWIDLAAGPLEYGPGLSGEGLLPRGEFHPLATLHTSRRQQEAFITDLASLVWSAAQMLLVPSLRIPVQYENRLAVHFIHIRASEQDQDTKGPNFDNIEKAFLDDSDNGPLIHGQNLIFKRHTVQYSACAPCVAAVSKSLRSYTSRFLFENYTLIVSEYLDSKQLHFALRHAQHEIESKFGIVFSSSARLIPVYILDLDHDRPLLLDRYHQAMAFKDMVLAVRTRSPQTVSDYTCNGRHIIAQIRELERPIVGSLLQTLWGVTPTHLSWSPQHNNTIVDYTWAVGQTPFGPFSDLLSLSFVQRDAARRNGIFTALNSTVSSAREVLQSVRAHGGEMKLLGKKRHVEFLQRWNVFLFKLRKGLSSLSHFDFNTAMYFMQSSEHDLFALHKIVYEAAQELQATLVCFQDAPFPWRAIILPLGPLAVLVYIWARKDVLFSNKKKRF